MYCCSSVEESATCERQLHSARVEEERLSAEVQAAADRVTAADLTVEEPPIEDVIKQVFAQEMPA